MAGINLQSYFPPGVKVIELGGGQHPLFHPNVDTRQAKEVDIVADLNFPLPISSESYDRVYARFVIEHLSWRKVRGFIAEVYRILSPGGQAIIITANLLEQARVLVNAPDWDEDLVCMIFGAQEFGLFWDAGSHHCGFSPQYAVKLFTEAGFYSVEVSPLPECTTDMAIIAEKSRARIVRVNGTDSSLVSELL